MRLNYFTFFLPFYARSKYSIPDWFYDSKETRPKSYLRIYIIFKRWTNILNKYLLKPSTGFIFFIVLVYYSEMRINYLFFSFLLCQKQQLLIRRNLWEIRLRNLKNSVVGMYNLSRIHQSHFMIRGNVLHRQCSHFDILKMLAWDSVKLFSTQLLENQISLNNPPP